MILQKDFIGYGNLLNGVLHFDFYNFFKKIDQRIKEWHLSEGKNRIKKNSATIMIYVDWKETIFSVKMKLQGEPYKESH